MRPILTPHNIKLALLAVCLQLPLPSLALEADKDQPINLESDTADIDDNKGTSIYKGNVVVTQGSIRISGDTLTVYSPGRTLNKVRVEGNPARYSERPDDAVKDMRAQGQIIEYYVDTNKLMLQDGAHVWNANGDEISGTRIDYDLKAALGKAISSKSDKNRVRVIIQPAQDKPGAGSTTKKPATTSKADDSADKADAPASSKP